jgi:cell division protein ZapA (FtsZ GTPase activity inhibitor)
MAENKVTVRIHGQDYTITGDKSQAYIERVAQHVDRIMNAISEAVSGASVSSLAVLTAVNIADELFSQKSKRGDFDGAKERLRVEAEHNAQLLEKTRREFQQYKRENEAAAEEKLRIEKLLEEKSADNERLERQLAELDGRISELSEKNANLSERLNMRTEGHAVSSEQSRELEDRLREVEGNYFELQMENIRMKGELDSYRREED